MFDLHDIYGVIEQFTQVGFMEGIKAMQPTADRLRSAEVVDWLTLNYAGDIKTFRKLEREGLIKSVAAGSATNSPRYYSKAEIKRAFATKGICDLAARYNTKTHHIC